MPDWRISLQARTEDPPSRLEPDELAVVERFFLTLLRIHPGIFSPGLSREKSHIPFPMRISGELFYKEQQEIVFLLLKKTFIFYLTYS